MLIPSKNNFMIVALNATANDLANSAGNFKWPELDCEKCSCRMWGHGFVGRYFACLAMVVMIKRLICPCCGMVVIFRPREYWARFRSSVDEIYLALKGRIETGFWPMGFKRQRGWHWLKKFMVAVRMNEQKDPVQFLNLRFEKKVHFFV